MFTKSRHILVGVAVVAVRLPKEVIKIGATVISAIPVSRRDIRKAEQFKQDCISQMRPFTRAVIAENPRNLGPNIHGFLSGNNIAGYDKDLYWNTEEAGINVREYRRLVVDMKNEHRYMAMTLAFCILRVLHLHEWAMQRKLAKMYAGLSLLTN